jgi:hypothetical protein
MTTKIDRKNKANFIFNLKELKFSRNISKSGGATDKTVALKLRFAPKHA